MELRYDKIMKNKKFKNFKKIKIEHYSLFLIYINLKILYKILRF